jgi:hypothetical protein
MAQACEDIQDARFALLAPSYLFKPMLVAQKLMSVPLSHFHQPITGQQR